MARLPGNDFKVAAVVIVRLQQEAFRLNVRAKFP